METLLTIELVPHTCWFSNVRDHVDRETWDRLSRRIYADVNRMCAVCGGRGPKWPVECHELWEYDDEARVQKLVGLTGLCPACHEVKHMGLASIRGRGVEAREHLAHVNGWTTDQVSEYVTKAFRVWRGRSEREWTLDMTWLERLGVRVESKRAPIMPLEQAVSASLAAPSQASAMEPDSGEENRTQAQGSKATPPSSPGASSSTARKPSEVTDDYWVGAQRRGGTYPAHTARGGKWLVFVPAVDVDAMWMQITATLDAGDLGDQAKVSTARPNPNATDPARNVVCVYTYDGDDETDVWRVRAGLRRLGITQPLSWKADHATRDGLYQVRGHTRMSRYRG